MQQDRPEVSKFDRILDVVAKLRNPPDTWTEAQINEYTRLALAMYLEGRAG